MIGGAVYEASLFSAAIGRTLRYRVYLPPDYYAGTRRYPVLYMLHGAGGNYTEWSDEFLPERADELMRSGAVQPFIVVMPDGGGRSYWANWPDNGPRWADYVLYEVVPEVDRTYRTLPSATSRAVGGLSMGGLGALNLALRHPDVFGVVGGHSPSIRPTPDGQYSVLSGASFYDNDPIGYVQRGWVDRRQAIWVDVGSSDNYRGYDELFRDAAFGRGLDLTWREFPGTHEAEYWAAHASDYVRFYGQRLQGEASMMPTPTPTPDTSYLEAF